MFIHIDSDFDNRFSIAAIYFQSQDKFIKCKIIMNSRSKS
jgi:hypothetical protein